MKIKKILFSNLVFPLIWILVLYFFIKATVPTGIIQSIRLTQYFAFSAVVILYLSILIEGLFLLNSKKELLNKVYKYQSIFIFSAFLFGLIHGVFAFFTQLGGISGLSFLTGRFLFAIILSTTSLVLLFILQFKYVQKLALLVGGFSLAHAFLVGTHFSNFDSLIVKITFVAFASVLFIYALLLDKVFARQFKNLPTMGFSTIVVVILITFLYFNFYGSTDSSGNSLSVHSEHIKQAENLQNQTANGVTRFSTDFDFPQNIKAGSETEIKIKVYDAATGMVQKNFDLFSEKLLHLIIVDYNLEFFNHLHPELKDGEFSIKTIFPENGRYHLYADFQPTGNTEQQFATSITVGQESTPNKNWEVDKNLMKSFGKYQINLNNAKEILTFTIKNSDGSNVTTLHPYLGSFGHLVMINAKSYEYIHVHPLTPVASTLGGPNVLFSPVGLYGPIPRGVYRLFGQFNPNGELITADFTIEIK